ncbi:hypothetical protein Tco_0675096 [Tanacetum coccineum]
MIDYALWEVIENGATLPKTTAVEGVEKEGSILLMAMRLLVLISPKWSAITATRGDILQESVELHEIKTTRTSKAQEGVFLWKHLLPQLWCHVSGLGICLSNQAKEEA